MAKIPSYGLCHTEKAICEGCPNYPKTPPLERWGFPQIGGLTRLTGREPCHVEKYWVFLYPSSMTETQKQFSFRSVKKWRPRP